MPADGEPETLLFFPVSDLDWVAAAVVQSLLRMSFVLELRDVLAGPGSASKRADRVTRLVQRFEVAGLEDVSVPAGWARWVVVG